MDFLYKWIAGEDLAPEYDTLWLGEEEEGDADLNRPNYELYFDDYLETDEDYSALFDGNYVIM